MLQCLQMSTVQLILGIAGGSGSGKTTVARIIEDSFGSDAVTYLSHDAYYRDQSHLSMEERMATNYDHPDSLETELLLEHLQQLRSGKTVNVPQYDF